MPSASAGKLDWGAMSRLILIHVSDTHFALPGEELGLSVAAAAAAGGALTNGLRTAVMKKKGTRPAERRLWQELSNTLQRTTDALQRMGERDVVVVHTGDITQAGQFQSLMQAIQTIESNAKPFDVYAVVGNHDLWPSEFPALAPSKTAHQFGHVRSMTCVPSASITLVPLGSRPTAELFLCSTAVADSLMNSVALGRFEPAAGHLPRPSQPPNTPPRGLTADLLTGLRIAALHHPIIDAGSGRWRDVQRQVGWNAGMVLMDANEVQTDLVDADILLALCGHEHAPAPLDKRLCCDDRLLQLTAGCPTLWEKQGNEAPPQLSLYVIEKRRDRRHAGQGAWLTLDSYICRLEPERWSAEASYHHDGAKWFVPSSPQRSLPSLLDGRFLGKKSNPPFT